MSDHAKDELVLAFKEMLRQGRKMEGSEGADEVSPALPHGLDINDMESALRDYRAGLITIEEAQAEIARVKDLNEQFARQLGDPAMIVSIELENEAKSRGLSETAQLLSSDAGNCAGNGMSMEEWIAEVLRGHAGDQDVQRRCLQLIVDLWSDGPWPWPRNAC